MTIPWHRLFGLTLTDFFLNTAYEVELEKDLSMKQQLLDVVIMLPSQDFRLYAVSTRHPAKLADQVDLTPAGPGVYDVRWGIRDVRIIVLSRIVESPKNAPWLMFSADADKVKYEATRYEWKSPVSGILNKLFNKYQSEGVIMPYTMEDFQREVKEELLGSLTEQDLERLLKGLRPKDRLIGLKPEEIEGMEAHSKKMKKVSE
jgi:hypothetical protein